VNLGQTISLRHILDISVSTIIVELVKIPRTGIPGRPGGRHLDFMREWRIVRAIAPKIRNIAYSWGSKVTRRVFQDRKWHEDLESYNM
jgi:hypothetical protein